MSEANNPPLLIGGYQNRKEESRSEYLTACIDWMQLTVRHTAPESICEDILQIPYEYFIEDKGMGVRGARAFICYDSIRVLQTVDHQTGGITHYTVLMAGQGCRQFEKFLLFQNRNWFSFIENARAFKVNFPRIDLAIDDYKTFFDISVLKQMAKNGLCQSRLKIGKGHDSFSIRDGESRGETLNFGSMSSDFFMTFYEKNYEQAVQLGLDNFDDLEKWNRYELKFRHEYADKVAKLLVEKRDVMQVVMPILNEKVRFIEKRTDKQKSRCPVWKPWEEFMKNVSKIGLSMSRPDKSLPRFYSWLSKSVAPSLWIAREIERQTGQDLIQEAIEEARITEKHRFDLEKYMQEYNLSQNVSDISQISRKSSLYLDEDFMKRFEAITTKLRQKETIREARKSIEELLEEGLELLCDKYNLPHLILLKKTD